MQSVADFLPLLINRNHIRGFFLARIYVPNSVPGTPGDQGVNIGIGRKNLEIIVVLENRLVLPALEQVFTKQPFDPVFMANDPVPRASVHIAVIFATQWTAGNAGITMGHVIRDQVCFNHVPLQAGNCRIILINLSAYWMPTLYLFSISS
jgi:hypothetical protein